MLTKDQLLNRKKGIGGSDIGAILGYGSYNTKTKQKKTAIDVYFDKIDEEIDTEEMTDAQLLGNLKEYVIRKMYVYKTGDMVLEEKDTLVHPKYNFILGNLDGIILADTGDRLVFEMKTADENSRKQWGEPGTDQIPMGYLLQVIHYCSLIDAPKAHIAVLIGANDFRIYTYERNISLEERVLESEYDFWNNNILKRIPPKIVNSRDCSKLFPSSLTGKTVYANDICSKALEGLFKINKDIKLLEDKQDSLKIIIKKHMKDSEQLVDEFDNKLASWKSHERKTLDMKSFEKDYPNLYKNIYKKYIKSTDVRSFRIC